MDEREIALEAIRKKLVGKTLSYKEIFAIMDEISHNRLGDILTTYFTASGYSKGFTHEELYFLTRAMAETGEKLHFSGIVADKHSIGGVPGTRTSLIVTPIVAAAGFIIPKSSSRAITTPAGTADDMEILAPVEFTKQQIYQIVKKTNACIVWGGSFNIAPADDILIHVERPLLFESFDKIIVSIMAKKVAFGSNHIVIDLPYGPYVKVHRRTDAEVLKEKFEFIARKFDMHIRVLLHETLEPIGRGIGPVLETRDAMQVLEQDKERPLDLEHRALNLATELLSLCIHTHDSQKEKAMQKEFGSIRGWATHILQSGQALSKMQEIIRAQGGKPENAHSSNLLLHIGRKSATVHATSIATIKAINSKHITAIAKILGCPLQKGAGIYLQTKIGDRVQKGDPLFTLYSENMYNLKEARNSLKNFPIVVHT